MNSFLENLGSFLPIVLLTLFLVRYNQNKQIEGYKSYCIYLGFIMLVSSVSHILFYLRIPNLFFSHVYFIGESVFLILFFKELVTGYQKKVSNLLLATVISTLSILIILDVFDFYLIEPFSPFIILICAIPIFILSIIHLYNSVSNSLRFLYITFGIIVYKMISVFAFILQNFANTGNHFDKFSFLLWKLNSIFLVCYYSLIFFEWYKNFRRKKTV